MRYVLPLLVASSVISIMISCRKGERIEFLPTYCNILQTTEQTTTTGTTTTTDTTTTTTDGFYPVN
ncbi:MAG: hypothetical protein ABDH21_02740 [bacterium]